MTDGTALGVDLGTSNTVCAHRTGERILSVPLHGKSTLPSVVFFRSAKEVEVGHSAKARLLIAPEHAVRSAKRFMGDLEKSWTIHGREVTPVDAAAYILGDVREGASASLDASVSQAVITVPAYFNGLQKSRTREAAERAGFEVLELLKEPTAAAIAYGVDRERDQTVLVYDLGGGTFDVSLLKIQGNTFKELAIDGDTFLGGDDFDEEVKRHIIDAFEKQYKSFVPTPTDEKQILEAAESLKVQLSSLMRAEAQIVLSDGKTLELELKRKAYEDLIRPHVEETITILRRGLDKARLSVDEIGRIILVGGSTKTPLIFDRLSEELKTPYRADNVDEVVAHGAALRADQLAGGRPVASESDDRPTVYLHRITPFNLGLKVAEGGDTEKFSVMIPDQHAIPCEVSRTFSTEFDNQTAVPVGVFQGFGTQCIHPDVRFIGGFILGGIPPAPRGEPSVEVRFTMNEDDIVQVQARCGGVGVEPLLLDVRQTSDPAEVFGQQGGPVAVVLCIDVSGSMSGDPLVEAKKAATAYVDLKRGGRDLLGCVSFGSKAMVAATLQEDFSLVKEGIASLVIRGSTNMAGGVAKSITLLKEAPPGFRRQLILLTDGYPDSSKKVRKEIPKLATENITVHTVGTGQGYDRSLLEEIATKTGGVFVAADTIDLLADAFIHLAKK